MNNKSYKLSFEGNRYLIQSDGSVIRLGDLQLIPAGELTAKIKAEAKRLRANRNRRERYQAMRDLGLVKTPYGWE